MGEKLLIPGNEILPVLPFYMGVCFASGKILYEGRPVGVMYRETPRFMFDSGWRFLAGEETDAYFSNPDHYGLYDVNTIANYDPGIIPLLRWPTHSAFLRTNGGALLPVPPDRENSMGTRHPARRTAAELSHLSASESLPVFLDFSEEPANHSRDTRHPARFSIFTKWRFGRRRNSANVKEVVHHAKHQSGSV